MEEQVPQRVYAHIVVIRKNGSAGPVFKLTEKLCLIGRDPDKCLIRVIRPEVSHVHAQLSVNDAGVVSITNLSRTNLTIVNGTYIKSDIVLKDDDVFTIGMRSFKFRYPTENETILVTKKSSRKLPENMRDEETMDFGALKALQQQKENSNVQTQQEEYQVESKAAEHPDVKKNLAEKPEAPVSPAVEESKNEENNATIEATTGADSTASVVEAPAKEPVVESSSEESVVESTTEETVVKAPTETTAEEPVTEDPDETTAEAPAEEPQVEAFAEAPAEEPTAEAPIEAVVQAPAEAPVVEASVENTVAEDVADAAVETSVDVSVEAPMETLVETPMDASIETTEEDITNDESMGMDYAPDSCEELIQNDPEASVELASEPVSETVGNDAMEVTEEPVEKVADKPKREESSTTQGKETDDAAETVSSDMQVDQETAPVGEAAVTEAVSVAVEDAPTFELQGQLKTVLADVLTFSGLKPKQKEHGHTSSTIEEAADEDDIGDIVINKASGELLDESQFLTQHVTTESDILQNPRSLPRMKRSHSLRGQVRPRSISFHMHSPATSAEMSSQPQFQTLMEEESLDMVPEDESVQHVSPSPFGISKMQQRAATRDPRQLDSDDESFAIQHMHFEAPEASVPNDGESDVESFAIRRMHTKAKTRAPKEVESDAESFAIQRMHTKAKTRVPKEVESDAESFAIQRMHTKAKTRAPKVVESDGEEYGIHSLHPDQSFDSSLVAPGAQERLDAVSMEVCPSTREDALSDVEETEEMHFSQLYGEESMFSAAEGEQQDPTEVSVIESSETYREKANTGYDGDNEAPMSVRTEEPETTAEVSFAEDSLMDVGIDQVAEFVVNASSKLPDELEQSTKSETLAQLVSPIPEAQKQEVDTVECVAAGDVESADIASAVTEMEPTAAKEVELDATTSDGDVNEEAVGAGDAPVETDMETKPDVKTSQEKATGASAEDFPEEEAPEEEVRVEEAPEEETPADEAAIEEGTPVEEASVKEAAIEKNNPPASTAEAEDRPTEEAAAAEPIEEVNPDAAATSADEANPKKEVPVPEEEDAAEAPFAEEEAEEIVILGDMFDHTKLREAGFESDMAVPMSVAKALEEELNAAEDEEEVSEEEETGVKYNLRNRDNEEEEEEIAPPKKKQRRRRGDRRKNKVEVDVENDADNTENAPSNSKRKTRSKSKVSSHDHVEKTPGKRSLRARKSREMYDEPAESEDAPRRSKRSRAGLR